MVKFKSPWGEIQLLIIERKTREVKMRSWWAIERRKRRNEDIEGE